MFQCYCNNVPFKLHRVAAEFGYVMLPSFVDERRHFLCDNKIKLITRRLHRLLVDKRHVNCYVRYSSTYIKLLTITRTRSYRNSLILVLSLTYWSWLQDIICSVALALRVDIVSPAATLRLQQNLYLLCLSPVQLAAGS